MAPKKKEGGDAPAAKKGDETDTSCELFARGYQKNCKNMGVEQSAELKAVIEEQWLGEGKPITKVSDKH